MANYHPKRNGFNRNKSNEPRQQMTKEEYALKKEEERNTAYGMIDEGFNTMLSSPENFMQYLDTQARLDRYSVANAVLIMQQLPEATQLKDYKDWSEAGVTVKRGSRSLMILEPKEYTRENGTVGISYNVKRVFDISQTNSRRRNTPTVNRDPAQIVAAMLETSQIDYEISDKIPFENAAAYYEPESNMLLVRENVGDATKLFQAVAQELSLAEIAYNSDSYSRSEALYPAKCAAYMLCKKYGVDTKGIDIASPPKEWAELDNNGIREKLTMARDSVNEIGTKVYAELNKDREARSNDDMER